MDIRRFYVKAENITGDRAIITGDEFYHVTKVMRYKTGYKLIVCSGDGYDYFCEITRIGDKEVECKITEKTFNERELSTEITLYLGLIKPERMDVAVQKAVEIGVKKIVPVITEFTSEKTFKKDRAERIIIEACKQCSRAIVPEICEVKPFKECVDEASGDKLMAYEKETVVKAKEAFSALSKKVSLLIGSEGGFSQEEVDYAKSKGFKTFSLGKRILKSETAVIAATSALAIFTEE